MLINSGFTTEDKRNISRGMRKGPLDLRFDTQALGRAGGVQPSPNTRLGRVGAWDVSCFFGVGGAFSWL